MCVVVCMRLRTHHVYVVGLCGYIPPRCAVVWWRTHQVEMRCPPGVHLCCIPSVWLCIVWLCTHQVYVVVYLVMYPPGVWLRWRTHLVYAIVGGVATM